LDSNLITDQVENHDFLNTNKNTTFFVGGVYLQQKNEFQGFILQNK